MALLFKCSPFEFLDRTPMEVDNIYGRVLDVLTTLRSRGDDG